MKALNSWLQQVWYGNTKPPWYLRGLANCYAIYQSRLPPPPEFTREPKPVIVVGNVVAGGSGKTPLVIYLAKLAMQHGLNVAVIARIYKGRLNGPLLVTEDLSAAQLGDEPKLLLKSLACPVVVSKKRSQAIQFIINNNIECDLVISDDGLQHRHLQRAVEIGVMDADKGLGNGHLLPAGPLREPAKRLQRCQWLISKGGSFDSSINMQLDIEYAINLKSGEQRPLLAFSDQQLTAIAAIAHPDSFFSGLRKHGLSIRSQAFPDHYQFKRKQLQSLCQGQPLFMTEKDAVKCFALQLDNAWYVPLEVSLPESFDQAFIARCQALVSG